MFLLIVLVLVFLICLTVFIVNTIHFKKVISLFDDGNVVVTGLRGRGKDMLFANVIARRKKPYISNLDYKVNVPCLPLNLQLLNTQNTYLNFINGDIVPYDYPYPENADIFISDAGVYFPSQNQKELVRDFDGVVNFQALSRHLANANLHCNVQNLNRLWDKIREQSDIYIRCIDCKVLFKKFVVQRVVVYDKYDACLNRVEPYIHLKPPILSHGENRGQYVSKDEIALREFKERNGNVKAYTLIYKNKSNYDTRLFKKLLRGERNEEY